MGTLRWGGWDAAVWKLGVGKDGGVPVGGIRCWMGGVLGGQAVRLKWLWGG